MFEQSMIPKGNRKPWTLGLAVLGQLFAVGLMILIPLVYVDALPTTDLVTMLVAPPPPPPPPPPPAAASARPRAVPVVRHFDLNALVAPKTIPKQVMAIQDAPAATPAIGAPGVAGGVPGGVPGGQLGGVLGSVLSAVPQPTPPPPPPAPAKAPEAPAETPKVIHIGGNVQEAKLLEGPHPNYPPIAREVRVQGTVLLHAIIGADGKVENLSVVSGNPLLTDAAVNAVKHWVYKPTYLNGKAVQVETEIAVHFQLG